MIDRSQLSWYNKWSSIFRLRSCTCCSAKSVNLLHPIYTELTDLTGQRRANWPLAEDGTQRLPAQGQPPYCKQFVESAGHQFNGPNGQTSALTAPHHSHRYTAWLPSPWKHLESKSKEWTKRKAEEFCHQNLSYLRFVHLGPTQY